MSVKITTDNTVTIFHDRIQTGIRPSSEAREGTGEGIAKNTFGNGSGALSSANVNTVGATGSKSDVNGNNNTGKKGHEPEYKTEKVWKSRKPPAVSKSRCMVRKLINNAHIAKKTLLV